MRLSFDSAEEFEAERRRIHRLGLWRVGGAIALLFAGLGLIAMGFGVFKLSVLGPFIIPVFILIFMLTAGVTAIVKALELGWKGSIYLAFR